MNTHNIPDRLHDMRVYNNASNVMLGISKVTLPDMDYLTETMKGAGIAGEFESIAPGLLKALELGLDFNTVTKHTYSLFAPNRKGGVLLRKVLLKALSKVTQNHRHRWEPP